jgi:hypothetical protein
MTTPQITELDILTGESITRDMNETELAQYKADNATAKAQRQAEADRAALKTATLAKLGLTADEVAALLS